jgi:hypothetical protein
LPSVLGWSWLLPRASRAGSHSLAEDRFLMPEVNVRGWELWWRMRQRVGRANAASRRDAATATPTAATTGDEDGTGEDNRTHAKTAPVTKRAGNRTLLPDTGSAANERRPRPANA